MRRNAVIVACALALATACGGSSAQSGSETSASAGGGQTAAGGDTQTGREAPAAGADHHEHGEASGEAPQPTEVLADGSRLFGSALDAQREATSLENILADPRHYEGEVVKTEGEVAQVCQRQGCWMELRPGLESPGVRVPMAGHSFFLPQDIVGKQATIEGTVVIAPLSEHEREELEAEGGTTGDQDVSIEATGVLVQP